MWREAAVADDFVEREPTLGGEPPLRTSVRVAYDDEALYFFVEAEVPDEDVSVRTLRRDSFGIFDDDMVFLKIDPQLDRRTAYTLGVNADGAQIDMLVLEDGTLFIPEWDAVWEGETQRTKAGYTAEFRIPFAVLGVRKNELGKMGFNLNRVDVKNFAKYDWKLPSPPERFNAASTFGVVDGLGGIDAQRGLDIRPYLLARTEFENRFSIDPSDRPTLAAGADLRLQLSTASYAEASLFTDFAQVEVDEVQVAQDRFPLFFPERRPFFIHGLGILNFGTRQDAQLFFSRRVGLRDGEPIPLLGGLKVYGRSGPLQYAVLSTQSLERPAIPEDSVPSVPPENVTVARFRSTVNEHAWLGSMVLGKLHPNGGHRNHLATGLDGELKADDGRLRIYGFGARTYSERPAIPAQLDDTGAVATPRTPETSVAGSSAHASFRYQTLHAQPQLSWTWSDEDFDPAVGFYRRPGTASQSASVAAIARPDLLGLREVKATPGTTLVSEPDYRQALTTSYGGELAATWRNTMALSYDYRRQADEVQADFPLFGIDVAADRYEGNRHELTFSTPARQIIFYQLDLSHVQSFGGVTRGITNRLELRPSKHFTVGGSYTHLFGEIGQPAESFSFGFSNAEVEVAFTRDVVWTTLGRMNLEPGDEHVGGQSRLRWRYLPGSDAFLVFRTDHPLEREPDDTRERFYELTAKLTYHYQQLLGW